ncbi:hypothetical protein [Rhizobium sp. WSM1325]|uniref:hypothetical protein n=1 Tax=Rhizobium sp. WSM1325 TaxID=3444086 RepID=UPI001FDED392|nr:hypothetical protein [Rhizobium leguminosarum]
MPTILILEDEPFIALDIETVLEECGQRSFVTLSAGSDAVSWLKDIAIRGTRRPSPLGRLLHCGGAASRRLRHSVHCRGTRRDGLERVLWSA